MNQGTITVWQNVCSVEDWAEHPETVWADVEARLGEMSERLIHAPEDWSNLQQAVRDLQQQLQAQRERAEAAEGERDQAIRQRDNVDLHAIEDRLAALYMDRDEAVGLLRRLLSALQQSWGQHEDKLLFVVEVEGIGARPDSAKEIAKGLAASWSHYMAFGEIVRVPDALFQETSDLGQAITKLLARLASATGDAS